MWLCEDLLMAALVEVPGLEVGFIGSMVGVD